ncbi:MAG TPA: ArsA family ATPase [Polyangiaceae bacterium]
MKSNLDRRRFLFVTGKGGVGKTTVTLALASALARSGKRVLVAVANKRDQLSELLGTPPLGTEITELLPGLSAVLLSAEVAIREYGHLKLKSRVLADSLFDNRYVQGFFAGAPGLKEWALLGKAWYHSIEEVDGEPRFDVVLFDAPATGHGLDMLRVPKVIVELSPPGLLRTDAERAWRMFQDPEKSGVVVVTLPEELPVNETEELVLALRTEIALPIAALVVNGVRPALFDESARAELSALAPRLPLPAGEGVAAVAAGVRRAVREGIQAESRARLRKLALPELELPALIGGVTNRATISLLADRFTATFGG